MSIDGEARPFCLDDFQRLQIGAQRTNRLWRVVTYLWWHWNDAVILDANNFHLVQIDNGLHPLHRIGITIVMRIGPEPDQAAHDATRLLFFGSIISRGRRLDHHAIHIGNAAPA